MSDNSQDIQVSVTPAVKDLRSLFEQKAKQAIPANPNASLRPGDSTVSSGSRPSISRRSSPTPLSDGQSDSHSEQNSMRKRPPPPPPPSRGPKQQIGSPSPSTSPRLRAALEPNSAPEGRSPPPSTKQRLATRLPPPVPDLRLDRTSDVEQNSNERYNSDSTRPNPSSTGTAPPPRPRRPVQPATIQTTPFEDPFESNSGDDLPTVTHRPNQKPPLPRRPARSSFPPDPDDEPEFDEEAVRTNALALDVQQSQRKPALYTTPRDSHGRSSTGSSRNMSRVSSEGDRNSLHQAIPPGPPPHLVTSIKLTDEPLSTSPVSPFGTPAPPLPSRRPPFDGSSSSSPSHPTRKVSGQSPPPVHPVHSPPPSRIPSLRQTPHIYHSRAISASASYPRAPPRKQSTFDIDDVDAGSQTTEADITNGDTGAGSRKHGSVISKLPPPPTRIIGLGDRLPAVRPTLSDDDESEEFTEEEDAKTKLANAMPDTSHSSRRPPVLNCHKYDTVQVQTQTHSAIICAAGHVYVTATGHHVKVYDLSLSESPILSLDHKDFGHKELKATSLEFCPANAAQDKGRYVWVGTKDGNMYELDVTTGQLMGSRLSIHLNAITRIIRHGDKMISVDDSGKVTIWMPGAAGEDLHIASAQVRHSRTSDRQAFVEMFAGKLWTSAREITAAGARGPAVRIYDILNPGSATRSVLPTENVGMVTSGTVLPSHPNHVYLGHVGGFVTIWSTATDDGVPVCEEVMRISNSDVLCLVGINDRLWVGGRNGTIAAYSVESRPWVMTNNWVAHWNSQSVLPLQRIAVDLYSIDKIGRLCVYSVGRDDHVKCWDGLLGADWQDTELFKLGKSFSQFRNITVLFVSWNIGATKPEQLSGSKENSSFLYDALNSVESPDIIVFGLQEVVPLDKANVAKFVKKKKGLEGASTTLHGEHRRWVDKLVGAVAFALPDERYKLLYSKELVGLLSCVMIKTKEFPAIRNCAAHTISRGVGNRFGNKGAVAVRLLIDDTSMCFLNCHLAAGHRRVRDRNADAAAIIEHERLFPELESLDEALALVGGGDGTMALDHEIVFMSGDLNYRIDHRRDAVVSSVQQNTYQQLLMHDQLTKEMKTNIRLRSFMEGPITFPPTYKYDVHSTEYDTSEKRRIPAWCDRVLWRARDMTRVEQLHYKRYEPDISDHRPITAAFRVLVKSIQHDAREKMKKDVEAQWNVREMQLLVNARAFYTEQLVL